MGVLLSLLIVYLAMWCVCFLFSECHYITFHKFIQYYTIDPDKWELEKFHVWTTKYTDFAFGPIGIIMYLIWNTNHNRKEINEELEELFGGKDETSI